MELRGVYGLKGSIMKFHQPVSFKSQAGSQPRPQVSYDRSETSHGKAVLRGTPVDPERSPKS